MVGLCSCRAQFCDKLVYKQDNTYWQQVEEVQRIYTSVMPDVSYGVQEEWRVREKVVEKVMGVLDESVSGEHRSHFLQKMD